MTTDDLLLSDPTPLPDQIERLTAALNEIAEYAGGHGLSYIESVALDAICLPDPYRVSPSAPASPLSTHGRRTP